jgi:hypothetical protein
MFNKKYWFNSPDLALFLRDPLQEISRKERKALLIVSILGIFIAHTGFVPTEINALGIVFKTKEQTAWYVMLALICLYFLCSFSLYCSVDYVTWRKAARADLFRIHKQLADRPTPGISLLGPINAVSEQVRKQVGDHYSLPHGLESQIWTLRCAFDMLLPILLGAYAIFILVFMAITHKYVQTCQELLN